MLKKIKTVEEVRQLKVGDLLQVTNKKDGAYKNIAVVIGFDKNNEFCLYNITEPQTRAYIHSQNFECWSRMLPNAKTTRNS